MFAQHKLNVRGKVMDYKTFEPLIGATAKLFNDKDSLLRGATTGENGLFTLENVPTGNYTLKVSFVGFKEQSFALKLPQRSGNFRTSDVLMREDATILKEAVVEGKLPEMTVVDDTVVYHADAFKVADGDMVEELVKKLPGVILEDDGTFTFNGKPISQVLVDGKEFFGNNRDLVLKNLPAEIIDKIKAYEKKSDRARITGVDDGNEKTVLDLTIKKDRKRGFMGNAEGGYGTKDRYSGSVRLNSFIGDQKFMVFGNANNTRGNGLSDNQSVGGSMNWQNKKIELNGSINGNFSQTTNESRSNSQNFEVKASAFSNNHNWSESNNRNGNFQYRVEWKPDSMWTVIIRPELQWGSSDNANLNESASFSENPYDYTTDPLLDYKKLSSTIGVNHRLGKGSGDNKNFNASGSVEVFRRLSKPGRNVSFSFSGGYNNSNNDSRNYTQTDYYRIKAYDGGDSVYHKTQFNIGKQKSYNVNAHVSYNEPIAREIYLQTSYSYHYSFRDNSRDVRSIFDPHNEEMGVTVWNYDDFFDSPYSVRDRQQCSYSINHYQHHDARLQLRINRTKFQLTAGGSVQPQISTIDYEKGKIDTVLSRTVTNISPTFHFRYKFSQEEQLNIRYNGNTGQPNMTDMIPDTLSDANPLNIRIGNATLKPSFTHNVNFDYNRAVPEYQRSYSLNAQFHTTQNSTTTLTEYNEETGGRVSMPVNVDGNWNASTNFNFNTALDSAKNWTIFSGTQIRGGVNIGYLYNGTTKQTILNRTRSGNFRQELRFTYRRRWDSEWSIEANANGTFQYHINRNDNPQAKDLDNYNFNYGGSFHVETPWGMTLRTDITEFSRRGYADASMNTNQLIWGASISQRLLPRRIMTISLRAQDILGQRDDINRSVSATSRTDTQNNIVNSYVLLTVNIRFGRFGGKGANRGKRDNANSNIEGGNRSGMGRGEGRNNGGTSRGGGRSGGGGGRRG
ncbi:MAG: outer membrane beta-barrel protein [Bacteroidaceae bacterium]|nr:outer membrane beta-barrel protein [Bacteroidaceae bacterium]